MSNPTLDTQTSAAQQAAARSDLALAYEALKAKAAQYKTYRDYYRGDQPQPLMQDLLARVFKRSDVHFTRNFCKVVIKSTADRIHLEGFEVTGDETATQKLAELVDATELLIAADNAHDGALVVGESFLIVWPDADGQPQADFNDARLCHLFYESANPRAGRMGAKWWVDETDGKLHLTLYYPDEIQYYVSAKKAEAVTSADAFEPDPALPSAANPYGLVPFFHLRPDDVEITSDLKDVLSYQDQINILSTNLMISAGFGGAPQKWIISAVDTQGKLKSEPGSIMDIPAGDGVAQGTQVGQFAATELANFSDAIDKLVQELSAVTSTPKFYFGAQGGDPSGEALITMESPLVKKARDRIDRFLPVWRRVAAFLLQLAGTTVAPTQIKPIFADPRTVQPLTQAQIRQANVAAGIPLINQLRAEGWSQTQIDQLLADKETEASAQSQSLASALLNQQRAFDQNTNGNGSAP